MASSAEGASAENVASGESTAAVRQEAPTAAVRQEAPAPDEAKEETKSAETKSAETKSAGVEPAQPKAKRRIGEDLIGDLFESMHELHFMADVVAGAEFVLSVLQDSLPSEVSIIHVFDINTGKFVVVRQAGGNEAVLMHQTPDSDSFVHSVMKAPRAKSSTPPDDDDYFKTGRWQVSGVKVKHSLSGPVRQGGRYLGLIELANPSGGDPYHESEANALDYICEQFAEFLVNRPIVLDADVILLKS
jgi:GAF domain-containing protein